MKKIGFNIWDDYWDDGYAPPGKVQETYAYVEEYDTLQDDQKEEIAEEVMKLLGGLDLTGVEYRQSGDHIYFTHLTHVRREQLVKELRASGLTYKGVPIAFYSES